MKKVEKLKGRKVEQSDRNDEHLGLETLQPFDKRIAAFLKKHHVLTLATTRANEPWVAHCFYAFLEKEACLVFTSDEETRHGMEMLENEQVACGVAWETQRVGQVRGAQITGRAVKVERLKGRKVEGSDFSSAKRAYLHRFPYAATMKLNLWVLVMDSVKFTDNRLGFGKKIYWERHTEDKL